MKYKAGDMLRCNRTDRAYMHKFKEGGIYKIEAITIYDGPNIRLIDGDFYLIDGTFYEVGLIEDEYFFEKLDTEAAKLLYYRRENE